MKPNGTIGWPSAPQLADDSKGKLLQIFDRSLSSRSSPSPPEGRCSQSWLEFSPSVDPLLCPLRFQAGQPSSCKVTINSASGIVLFFSLAKTAFNLLPNGCLNLETILHFFLQSFSPSLSIY